MEKEFSFNGLGVNLSNLARVSKAKSRSISAENFTGEKGKGGMATEGTGAAAAAELGQGWKISACIKVPAHEVVELAKIEEPGAIEHIWMTVDSKVYREYILRFYWDGETEPSVCCPIGDFFCNGWCERTCVVSEPVAVNPSGGFNCYWEMPFRKSCRVTVENIGDRVTELFYQFDHVLTEVPEDMAYFHAMWRRENPVVKGTDYTVAPEIRGTGHYVGTYVAYQSNNCGWWGEGEMKFFMDGDTKFPTICTTGTEDYFGGAWCFFNKKQDGYQAFSAPYCGMPQVILPDGFMRSQTRFGMYRWHVRDAIRFQSDLRVTLQCIGWTNDGHYLPLQDDVASVAFWYQLEPHVPYKQNLERRFLEVI